MFRASVDTDVGDHLRVLLDDGRIGGKALLSFITGLAAYCSETDIEADMQQWFSKLEMGLDEPICRLTHVLLEASYNGEWDYYEDEYEWFLHRTQDTTVSEEKFRETIHQLQQKWRDVQLLLKGVKAIREALAGLNLVATWWYEPDATEADFQALLQTVSLAVERGAEKIRIKFT